MNKKRWAAASLVILALASLLLVTSGSVRADPDPDKIVAHMRAIQAHHSGQGTAQGGEHRAPVSRNLSLVGTNDFGGRGFNADVWAHGKYAYVGTWGLFTNEGLFCPAQGTIVADISNPESPDTANVIPAPDKTQTNDVKVARVSTRYFRGDLLVVSNEDCEPGGARGFELWDVTDPLDAERLGRYGPEEAFDIPPDLLNIGFGVHNTYIFENRGRVYVAAVVDGAEIFQLLLTGTATVGDLHIVDVTDPSNPVRVADWGTIKNLGLDPFDGQGEDSVINIPHDVWVERNVAYVSEWDAGLVMLDVSDPTDPQFLGRAANLPGEEGNTHVAVPAWGGNLVLTGDEEFTPGPWGFMRIYDTSNPAAPQQIATFATENALSAPPPAGDFTMHNVVVRGNSAYVSWYSDGIRVIDISQPHAPRESAFFVPEAAADPFGVLPTAPEMWGIYVQDSLILGSDMNAGLYVLKHTP